MCSFVCVLLTGKCGCMVLNPESFPRHGTTLDHRLLIKVS